MSLMLLELSGLPNRSGPPGDPAAARAAAQRFTAAQEALRARQASVEGIVGSVVPADWVGPAATSFRGAAQLVLAEFPIAIQACQRAAVALNRYAAELEDAQARTASVVGALADLDARADRLNAADTSGLTGAEADRLRGAQAQETQAEAGVLEGQLAAAQAQAAEAARKLREELEAVTALAPRDVVDFMDRLNALKTSMDPLSLFAGIRDIGVGLMAGGIATSVNGHYRQIVGPLLQGWGPNHSITGKAQTVWKLLIGELFPGNGTALTVAALGRSGRTLGEAAIDAADAAAPLRSLGAAGRVLGPVGGALDLVNAFQGDPNLKGGWHVADRVVSAVSASAAAYSAVATVGVAGFSMTPPGLVAVGVVSAATAAWSIGKWGYQNRENIAEFMVDRWNDASDLQERVNKAVTDSMYDTGKTISEASEAIGDALEDSGDAGRVVRDGLETVGGWIRR